MPRMGLVLYSRYIYKWTLSLQCVICFMLTGCALGRVIMESQVLYLLLRTVRCTEHLLITKLLSATSILTLP